MADGVRSFQPEDYSLGDRLESLLDILAAEGLLVGPRERSAAHFLAVREMEAQAAISDGKALAPDVERDVLARLGSILAPLIARTREERERFARVFDTVYPPVAAPQDWRREGSTGSRPEMPRSWIRRYWLPLAVAALALVGFVAVAVMLLAPQPNEAPVELGESGLSTTEITGAVANALAAETPQEHTPQTSERLLQRVIDAAELHGGAPTLREIARDTFDDAESLASMGAGGNEATAQYELRREFAIDAPLRSAAFSPDGARIVTASDDRTARVIDTSTGAVLVTLTGHAGIVYSASFSPDGGRIVTASRDGSARIWDAGTGAALLTLKVDGTPLWSAAYSPDGGRIVSASDDRTARIWNAATGTRLGTLTGHEGAIQSAEFSPDGARIVTASADRTARVWNATTGEHVLTLTGHGGQVWAATFSPDGALIATASEDGTTRLWNAATGSAILTLAGHGGPVSSVSFSDDGVRIVTASSDMTARVWNARTGEQVATLEGHTGVVLSAAFSQDGMRIVTASADNTARLWEAKTAVNAGLSWSASTYAERLSELTGFPIDRPLAVYGADAATSPGLLWARLGQALGRIEQPGQEPPLVALEAAANLALSNSPDRPRAYRVLARLATVFPNPDALAPNPEVSLTPGDIAERLIAADENIEDPAAKVGEGSGDDIARALGMAGYPTQAFHHLPWLERPPRPASQPPPAWLPWLALGVPLAAALWFARSLFLLQPYLRRRPPRIPPTHTELVSEAGMRASIDTAQFQRAAQRLRVRTARPSAEIDVPATIAATLRSGGQMIELVQANARARPDYLVLVERLSAGDHEALRMQKLVERLSELVDLDIYHFQVDPGEIEPAGGRRRISIEEAQARHPDHRLIILGSGAGLLDPLTFELREAARKLMFWPRRVLLTPIPLAEWSREEYALAEGLAMPVGRATPEGLQFLAELLGLEGGEAAPQPDPRGDGLARPLPELLRLRPQRFLFNTTPNAATLAELVVELRNVLTPAEFEWFAALAVYPSVQWDLTLFLGVYLPLRADAAVEFDPTSGPPESQKLKVPAESLYSEARLAAITQLPWLKAGRMPNWLRTRLIAELSPKRAGQVRAILGKALESSRLREGATPEEQAVFRIAEDRIRSEPRKEALPPEKLFDDDVLLDFLAGSQRDAFSVPRLPTINGRFLRSFWERLGGPGSLAGLAALAFGLTGFLVAPRGTLPVVTGAYAPLGLLALGALLTAILWRPGVLGRRLSGALERTAPGAFALAFAMFSSLAFALTPMRGVAETLLLGTRGAAIAAPMFVFITLSIFCGAGLLVARWLGERLGVRIHAAPLYGLRQWGGLAIKALMLGACGLGLATLRVAALQDWSAVIWAGLLFGLALAGVVAARFAPDRSDIKIADRHPDHTGRLRPAILRTALAAIPIAAASAFALHVQSAHTRTQLVAGAEAQASGIQPERAAISADGNAILTADALGRIRLSRTDGQLITETRAAAPITALVLGGAPESRRAAFADADGRVFIWPAGGTPQPVRIEGTQLQSRGAPAQLAIADDGAILSAVEGVTLDDRAVTRVAVNGRLLAIAEIAAPPSAVVSLDADRWALATLDGQVHVLSARQAPIDTWVTLARSPSLPDGVSMVRTMSVSGNGNEGNVLHMVGIDGALMIARVASGEWGDIELAGMAPRLALGPAVAWATPTAVLEQDQSRDCTTQQPPFPVYFEWERNDLTSANIETINAAVARARSGGCSILQATVEGHTDSATVNDVAVSARRAEAVKLALISAGVSESVIVTAARGASEPAEPRPDGTREPLNRRAEVQFTIGRRTTDELRFLRYVIDSTQDVPRACLQFSAALDPQVDLRPFLDVGAGPQLAITVDGSYLCIGGLKFGDNHEIGVRSGLPARDGRTLPFDEAITITFSNRPESLEQGTIFRDRIAASPQTPIPEMVVLPSGSFTIGSPDSEEGREPDEGPQRRVSVPSFAAGRYEVTWTEYAACVSGGGCTAAVDDGFGKGLRPVTNVSWDDAQAYVKWLSAKTGETYRLLSEAEWEYVARAGSRGSYPWGGSASHEYANYGKDECCDGLASGRDKWVNTSPVGSFVANAFGLHDMHGNVYEWVQDCYADNYSSGQPSNGSAYTSGSCSQRVIRGGSWYNDPQYLRSAFRRGTRPSNRDNYIGFRVARTLAAPTDWTTNVARGVASNAVKSLDTARVALILRDGWDPNAALDIDGNNALHTLMGVCEKFPEHDQAKLVAMTRFLLANGANMEIANKFGDTPLMIARSPRYCGSNHPVLELLRSPPRPL